MSKGKPVTVLKLLHLNPDDTVDFCASCARLVSVHRGGEMLSSYEVPQLSELFVANAMLTVVRLPPLPASADTAVDTESIYLLLIDERRQTGSASFLTLIDEKTS